MKRKWPNSSGVIGFQLTIRLKNILSWNYSLANRFLSDSPGATFLLVSACLVSQASLILAFFLPLKVLILLGSPTLPGYFPKVWLESVLGVALSRESIIISLSALAAFFYIAYLVLEWAIDKGSSITSKRLLKKTQKAILFEGQETIAARAYKRFSQGIASVVVVVIAFVGLGFFYPALAMFFTAYLVVSLAVTYLLLLLSFRFRAKLKANDLGLLVGVVSSVGFLLSFLFMVYDVLSGSSVGIFISIISLLLLRQALQRFASLIQDVTVLHNQRNNISALFFRNKALDLVLPIATKNIWDALEEPRRTAWISDVLSNVLAVEYVVTEISWHQITLADVFAFEVVAHTLDDKVSRVFFVKLFNVNRSAIARHESYLFSHFISGELPALDFIGAHKVGDLLCNAFAWRAATKLPAREVWLNQPALFGQLMAVEPPRELLEQYLRSHPPLWQRLNKNILNHLLRVAGSQIDRMAIENLNKSFGKVVTILKSLPVQIVNPDLSPDTLLQNTEGKFLLSHWGRWSVEPVGAGYPVTDKGFERLEVILAQCKEQRTSLHNVTIEQISLASLMFDFERTYTQQKYSSTLQLLPLILSCLSAQNVSEV